MLQIKIKDIAHISYSILISIFFSVFINFYFFDENGRAKIEIYQKKKIELQEKKEFLLIERSILRDKIDSWKKYLAVREAFGRENLDLIKEGEIYVNF